MHPLAWTLALGLLSLTPSGCSAPPSSPDRPAVQDSGPESHPEPESQTLQKARGLFEQAKDARERKDLDQARAFAASAIELLVGLTPGSLSLVEDQLLFDLGTYTHDLGNLRSARAARERVVLEREGRLPVEHPDLAAARGTLANTLSGLGNLAAARALQERVLEVRQHTLPPDHPDLTRARGNLANTLYSLGNLTAARDLQERVLEVRERTLAPDHPDLVVARHNLANTLRTLGDLDAARLLQERVLEVFERTLPPDHPDLAKARGNLADTLYSLGDLAAARALFVQVLEVFERTLPSDHPNLATARSHLAATLYTLGDLAAARALQERVLELFERALPPDHPDLAAAQHNLATTLRTLGDLAAARALEERVLEVFERTLPPDHPDLTATRSNLAATLSSLGDRAAARALQESVLEVFERTLPPDHPLLSAVRQNLANTLSSLGDLAAARALQERVLELRESTLPPDHPDLATTRGNLAITLKSLGDLAAARALEERVLEARESTLPPDHPDLAVARLNLAVTLRSLGDLAAARALQERVLEVRERTLPPDHPELARAQGNLAETLGASFGVGEDVQAEEWRKRGALTTLALDLSHVLRRMTQSALLDGSPREVEERLASQAAQLARTFSLARGYGFLDLGPDIVREVFLLSEMSRAGGLIASRLAARVGSDALGIKLRARISTETEALARLAQSGGDAEALGQARTAVDQAGRDLSQHASRLLGSAAPLEPTLEALTRGLGPKDALVAWRRTTLHTIQRGDPPTSSDVDSLIAFVLRSVAPSSESNGAATPPNLTLVDLGPFMPIEQAAELWRNTLGASVDARGLSAHPASATASGDPLAAERLRRLVLDPLHTALAGVERVTVALDDTLHAVPLDAMPAGDLWAPHGAPSAGEERLLGDVLRIELRSSLIELLLPEVEQRGEAELLAIGGASFDADPTRPAQSADETSAPIVAALRSDSESGVLEGGAWARGFTALPGTRDEAQGIVHSFVGAFGQEVPARMLDREKASREALLEIAPSARWLHIATHGWFAPESVPSSADPQPKAVGSLAALRLDESERVRGMSPMLLCGLALAGANLPMNSVGRIPGLVTAQEIAALDLSNCELAVLSACDTNVGVRRAGQGVASLQKALHMAGARSVITSLWKVPDEATKDLMIDFYRRLWVEKKPKHQALWEAKSKLRNARDERGNPRYTTRDWAAWVLTGSPD